MTWLNIVVIAVATMLVLVLLDLVGSGGKWCARFAERIGLVARRAGPRTTRSGLTRRSVARTDPSAEASGDRRREAS